MWEGVQKPEIFCMTLDITKCYDSIDQQKLLKMFKENELIDNQYLSNRYLLLTRNRRALVPGQKK